MELTERPGEPADLPGAALRHAATPAWQRALPWVLATACLQLAFWFVVDPLLFGKPDMPPRYAIRDVQEAQLPAPDAASLGRARFSPAQFPWTACCAPGYRALRFTVDIPQVPEAGVALVPLADVDNMMIRINGQQAAGQGRMVLPHATYELNVRGVLHLPAGVFKPGANRVEFIMVRQSMPYFDVATPIFADHALAWPRFAFRQFIVRDFELMGIAVGSVVALLAALLLLRSTQRGLALALLVLAGSWTLYSQFYFWTDPPLSADARMLYYFALANLLPVGWFNFVDQWTRQPWPRAAAVTAVAYACCMVATAWALQALPAPDGYDRASDITNRFGIVMSLAALLRMLWNVVRGGRQPAWEFAVFALCMVLLVVDLVHELLWDEASLYVIRCIPILLLAFLVAFLGRNVRLFQSTHQINHLLRQRLEVREAQLAATHQREKQLVQREAHQAERQRLMRDMHDGVGSQLTALLFSARRGSLTPAHAAEGLQAVLEEMRLLIDSMDTTRDSLAGALENFRERITPHLQAAGIALDLAAPARELLSGFSPAEVLNVLRIVREACSNALRHSGCRRISIAVLVAEDPVAAVRLVIRDDGKGLAGRSVTGHGLTNMAARAAELGARFEVRDATPGVEVSLVLSAVRAAESP